MRCYPSSGPIEADDQPESLWVRSSLVLGEIMASIEKALQIAAGAHEGQKDKDGQPYILHPLRVMNAVESEPAKVVAVLHDVIEDTWVTAEDLRREGFDKAVLAAVECLTHRKGEPYADYVVRSPSPLHPSQVGPSSPGYTDDGLLEPGVPCRPVATRRAALARPPSIGAELDTHALIGNWVG